EFAHASDGGVDRRAGPRHRLAQDHIRSEPRAAEKAREACDFAEVAFLGAVKDLGYSIEHLSLSHRCSACPTDSQVQPKGDHYSIKQRRIDPDCCHRLPEKLGYGMAQGGAKPPSTAC